MSRPFRIEINCQTGERKEIPLTDEEIAQAKERDRQEKEKNAKNELDQKAHRDLTTYLMNWVYTQNDCPQSIKDYLNQ